MIWPDLVVEPTKINISDEGDGDCTLWAEISWVPRSSPACGRISRGIPWDPGKRISAGGLERRCTSWRRTAELVVAALSPANGAILEVAHPWATCAEVGLIF